MIRRPRGMQWPSRVCGAAASFWGACAAPPEAATPEAAAPAASAPSARPAEPAPRAEPRIVPAPPRAPVLRTVHPVPVTACAEGAPAQLAGPWLLHCPNGAPAVSDLRGGYDLAATTALPGPGPWALDAGPDGPVAVSLAGGVWTPDTTRPARRGESSDAPPAVSAGAPPVVAWLDDAGAHWRTTDADGQFDAAAPTDGWTAPAVARGPDGPWVVWSAVRGPGAPTGEARLYAHHDGAGGDAVRFGLGGFEHHPVGDGRWLAWVRDGDVVVVDLAGEGGPTAVVYEADAGAEGGPSLAGDRACWAERDRTVACDDGWRTEGTDPTGAGDAVLVRRDGQWLLWVADR